MRVSVTPPVGGANVTEASFWRTRTVTIPLAPRDVPVIVAVPLPTATTTPCSVTVATVFADEENETFSPGTAMPVRSLADATSLSVSPIEKSVSGVAGVKAIAETVRSSHD